MKTTEELIDFVFKTYAVKPEYLWPDYPETFVFRHTKNRKWFGVVMDVERRKLGLSGTGKVFLLDVKTGPILGGSFLGQPGVVKAWHMNKSHWLGVLLDGSASDQTIRELLDLSFSLTREAEKTKDASEKERIESKTCPSEPCPERSGRGSEASYCAACRYFVASSSE